MPLTDDDPPIRPSEADRRAEAAARDAAAGRFLRPLAEAVSGPNNAYVARSQYAANLRPYLEDLWKRT